MQIRSDEATQIPWVGIKFRKTERESVSSPWDGISRCITQKYISPRHELASVLRDFRATNVNNCDWKMNYLRSDI